MSSADRPPSFPQETSIYYVPEDRPTGFLVTTVTVVNSTDDSFTYSIVPGHQRDTNKPARFSIDPVTGAIRISAASEEEDMEEEDEEDVTMGLDREITETFELTVRAETRASPPLVAHTHITIKVLICYI